ncbi:type VI secretion system tip protein VgrG [Celerinatantimonas yamalensis]|uniref:Type VI secretion system tip protein VgrG n=1 Tax=Celerinatantimonas yamalensis TaxID=559956 RepID=A0ABW9G2A1_9GAMM
MSNQDTDGVVTFTIKADGSEIASDIGVIAINIFSQINQVAHAELLIADGDIANQTFAISETDTFKPGTSITISAGYDSDETTLYEGIVIKHAIHISGNNQTLLDITCKDQAVAMTIARKSKCYLKQTDSAIISQIISNYSGLDLDHVDSTSSEHDELTQFNCSDWDFLLTRAEANAMVVSNQSNKITVVTPTLDDSPSLTITYGNELIDLSVEVDPCYQLNQVTGIGWDMSQQQMVQGQASSQSINEQGNLSSSTLAEVLGVGNYRLQTSGTLSEDVLESWAKGQQLKSALSKIRGSVSFQGNADAKINTLIKIAGVGARFNGPQYISAVHHQIEQGQWVTTVDLGLSPMWSSEHRDLGAPPAAGWLPPVDGLQIGVVTQLNDDPQSQSRIQVKLPTLGDDDNLLWARLISYYATSSSGNFFIPEVGNEVLLGYINNDPSQPIILGSLYSSQHTPPYELTAENNTKAIVTKSQLKVEFNEEDKVITLITPGGNSIVLSDSDKAITISDQNDNKVTLNDSGISLESPKDISLSAKGAISLKATSNISLKANADVKGSGMNVSLEAQTGFTAKGSATAELSASGMTTIKGGLVKIN